MRLGALGLAGFVFALVLGACGPGSDTAGREQPVVTVLRDVGDDGRPIAVGELVTSTTRVCIAGIAGAPSACAPNGSILRTSSEDAEYLVLSGIPECVELLGVDSVGTISSLTEDPTSGPVVWRVVPSPSLPSPPLSELLVRSVTIAEDVWVPLPESGASVAWPAGVCI